MINCIPGMPRYDKSQKDWQANAGSYDRCPDCGEWKAKKAYRCRACSPKPAEAARARWKDDPSDSAAHSRAVRMFALADACERCARTVPLERHHKDGNPANNEPSNIWILCRRCHMEVDGRADALVEAAMKNAEKMRKPPAPCVECGKLSKPLRRGLCHACDERKRRRDKKAATPP